MDGADFVVWTFLWDNYVQVITANLLIASAIAIFVYIRSFSVPKAGKPNPELRELAPGGHTGNPLYDFFIGRELNPRIRLPISLRRRGVAYDRYQVIYGNETRSAWDGPF